MNKSRTAGIAVRQAALCVRSARTPGGTLPILRTSGNGNGRLPKAIAEDRLAPLIILWGIAKMDAPVHSPPDWQALV